MGPTSYNSSAGRNYTPKVEHCSTTGCTGVLNPAFKRSDPETLIYCGYRVNAVKILQSAIVVNISWIGDQNINWAIAPTR